MIDVTERAAPGLGRYERRYRFELERVPAGLGERIAEFFAARGARGLVIEPSRVRFSRGSRWGSCLPGPRHPQQVLVEVEDVRPLGARITCSFQGRSLLPTGGALRREVTRLSECLQPD